LDAISPAVWAGLEKRLVAAGGADTFEALRTVAEPSRMAIGIKRGLSGDPEDDYVWVLAPVYSADPAKPGNLVLMEAYSAGSASQSRATYAFRILPRVAYAAAPVTDALHVACDAMLATLNRCMIDVDFRREPIYLPDDRLLEPRYLRYWYAVQRLPALKTLRELFVGRVFHLSPEQWQADLDALLAFNISTTDDAARWKAATPEPADAEQNEGGE
jgi:hypothetical protein